VIASSKSSDDRDWGVRGHPLILIKRLIKRSMKLHRDSTPVSEIIQLTEYPIEPGSDSLKLNKW
jgi:hypothetical protein